MYYMKKGIEFFAGSAELSKLAREKGFEMLAVDWKQYGNIDLIKDIEFITLNDLPYIPDFAWFSFDCTTYSIAACSKHRHEDKSPKTEYAIKSDMVNKNCIKLINEILEINKDFVFFIENPRGNLRTMYFMQEFKRHTVWYCKYGDERAKPTDIWTNSKTWTPRPECHNYKYDKQGNIIDRHCHHESARRGAKTGTQGRKGSYERSLIPEQLYMEVLVSCL
jgi:hypothetical protein